MDVLAAFSGFFFAASMTWILAALFMALLLGAACASIFILIFGSASRLATAMENAYPDPADLPVRRSGFPFGANVPASREDQAGIAIPHAQIRSAPS